MVAGLISTGAPPAAAAAGVLCLLLCLASGPHVSAAPACPDFQPPGEYNCEDQKRFGKCDAGWMVTGGFCQQTCGRCPAGAGASPTEEELRATLNSQRLILTPITLPNATAPAAERPQAQQLPSRPALAAERPFFQPQRLSIPSSERHTPTVERAAQPTQQRRPATAPATEAAAALPAVAFAPVTESNATSGALSAVPFLYTATQAEDAALSAPEAEPRCNTSKTAWSVLSADPDLSITRQAVHALNLTSVLQSPSIKFTLFAPTNEAWNAAAQAQGQTPPELLSTTPAARDLVFTHIVPNRVFTANELASERFIIPQSNVPLFVTPRPRVQGVTLLSAGGAARTTPASPSLGCNFALYKIDAVLRSTPAQGQALDPDYAAALSGGGTGTPPAPSTN